jgi:hypothetical protein
MENAALVSTGLGCDAAGDRFFCGRDQTEKRRRRDGAVFAEMKVD